MLAALGKADRQDFFETTSDQVNSSFVAKVNAFSDAHDEET
jgi:hypothetical protein